MKNTFKQLNPHECTLKNTRIDIWQYPLHTEFAAAKLLLSQDELTRAQRYHFAKHQRRFTIARAMLRLILAQYLPISAKEISFTENKYGKPQLENAPFLQFNLSHSEDLALLAVGAHYPVGIDLEFFSSRPYLGIGKQMFSPLENQALNNLQPYLRPLAFFNMWAQKEALIKACGLGLSYPTQQFDVPLLPSISTTVMDSLHHQNWQMVPFMPLINCSAALCHHLSITEIRYLALDAAGRLGEL